MISLDWFRIHDPKDLATWGLTLVGTVVLTYVLIFTNGNVHAGAAFLLGLAVILITLLRVDWGLYLFLLLVFLFDQFPVPGMESFTFQIGYFNNLNTVGYLPRLEEGVVTPMELHLIFLLFVAFVVHAKGKDLVPVKIPARIPALLFILALVSSLVYGWVRGGNFIISLWETRALAYLGIMIILIPRIIKTEKQLQTLFWFFIIGISFKAVQGVIRFSSLGFTFGSWSNIHETFTNHEDPVFFITLFILLIALSLFGGYPKQQRALLGLLGLILLGFIAAQRRATYASFMATIAAFAVLLPKKERLMFIRPLAVFLLLFALYLGIFWNTDYGRLSTVALQFKATVLGEGGIRGEQDYSSTLYREQ